MVRDASRLIVFGFHNDDQTNKQTNKQYIFQITKRENYGLFGEKVSVRREINKRLIDSSCWSQVSINQRIYLLFYLFLDMQRAACSVQHAACSNCRTSRFVCLLGCLVCQILEYASIACPFVRFSFIYYLVFVPPFFCFRRKTQ